MLCANDREPGLGVDAGRGRLHSFSALRCKEAIANALRLRIRLSYPTAGLEPTCNNSLLTCVGYSPGVFLLLCGSYVILKGHLHPSMKQCTLHVDAPSNPYIRTRIINIVQWFHRRRPRINNYKWHNNLPMKKELNRTVYFAALTPVPACPVRTIYFSLFRGLVVRVSG
jgi:hypothetical protein